MPSARSAFVAPGLLRSGQVYNPLADTGITWYWAAYAGDPAQAKPGNGGSWSSWRAEGVETTPLVQATDTKQMTWEASNATMGGLPAWVGDGVDDFAQTANFSGGALAQAWVWVVVGCIAANSDVLVDGNDATNRGLFWRDGGGNWEANNGSIIQAAGADSNPHSFAILANGASSQIIVDGTSVVTGNSGANSIDAVTLCGNTAGAAVNAGPVSFVGLLTAANWLGGDFTQFNEWVESHGIGA